MPGFFRASQKWWNSFTSIDSTTSNGLDVSKQNNDEPVHSTINNELDVSQQIINEPVHSTTNNELDVSKQSNGISPIDLSLGILYNVFIILINK